MSPRRLLFRVLLPAAALTAVALFLYRCHPDEAAIAPVPVKTVPQEKPAPPPDPAAWSKTFTRQLPPPAELQPDPELSEGVLSNGLRYLILERSSGEGVCLRLLVLAGSMHEKEGEQGYAHFVEHMAFRGTNRYPQGDAVAVFERLGLKSGSHTNAFTSPDCTVWKLDVPVADELSLTTALQFLRDVADGILFREAETGAERGVVLRELEEREGKFDTRQQRMAAIFPSVPAAMRLPIGTRETLQAATATGLRTFWHREYVPSRMVLVAAGDLTKAEMLRRLRSHFESIPAREAPPPPPEGDPLAGEGAYVDCLTDPTATQTQISLVAPQPPKDVGDDPARRRMILARLVSIEMFSDRLGRLSRIGDAYCATRSLTPRIEWLEVGGKVEPAHWKEYLVFVAREWRRAVERGFEQMEFLAARRTIRQEEVRSGFSRRLVGGTAATADDLVDSARRQRVYETPEVEMNRSRSILESLTLAECEAAFREAWSQRVLRVLITGKEVAPLADEAQRILQSAWTAPVQEKPRYPQPRSLPATEPGPPGKVVHRALDAERNLLEVEMANGVRAFLKPAPGLGGSVSVVVHGGYGARTLPRDDAALRIAADMLAYWHPLPGWRSLEFNAALDAEEAGVKFAVGNSTFTWSGETSRDRLARQLEIMCACIHRPGVADLPEKWTPQPRDVAWMKARRIGVEFPDEIRRRLCGGDPRFAAFPDGFEGVDSARTVQWLLPALKDCRLCVMVAGDFVPEQALAALQSTFGALSARDPWKSALPFPKLPPVEPGTQTLRAKFTTAQVAMALPFPFAESRDDAVNAQLLMDLMQLRLRALFRSRLSAAYSPLPVFWSQPDLSQNWLLCPVRCESARIAEISGELHQLLDEVRQGKWSADEFQRVARPAGHSLARTLRDPEQWTRLPELVAVRPPLSALKPELLLTREAALKRLAAQVCQPASGIEFRLLPAEE